MASQNPNDILRMAKDKLDQALAIERRNNQFVEKIGPAIVDAIGDNLGKAVEKAIGTLKVDINPSINVPQPDIQVTVPEITVPKPEVTVNVPEIKVPKSEVVVKVPKNTDVINELKKVTKAISEQTFTFPEPERHTFSKPQPVILTDDKGKPYIAGTLGGGRSGSIFKWMDGETPRAVSSDHPLPVEATIDLSDTLTVQQLSGAVWSTYVTGAADSTFSGILNPDGRVKVELPSGSSGLTDTELRASGVPVAQVSGATWSTYVTGAAASTYAELLNADGRVKVEAALIGLTDTELRATSIPVAQVSGASWSTEATQAGAWNIGTVTTLTSVTNALETKQVSGFADSVFVTGQADSMMTYQARTTNPTAVSDGADVRPKADDLGRAIVTPVQVRDLRVTAYATLSTNSETTLLAGASSTFHDLVWIKFSNTSTGAVTIDLRETTGGTIIDTYEIPANATQGVASPIPIPQANVGGSWTVDYNDSDLSNTTVYVSGLFEKEV